MRIAVDFDGTIVKHEFPEIGKAVPAAAHWLREWISNGAEIILWTMRSDSVNRKFLTEAIGYCEDNGITLAHANYTGDTWTSSPKVYAPIYVDDAAFGCPLIEDNSEPGARPFVDWSIVGPKINEILLERIELAKQVEK